MNPTEHKKQFDDQQKLHAEWLKQQVALGHCPKCGSALHSPDGEQEMCRNCGNKFKV